MGQACESAERIRASKQASPRLVIRRRFFAWPLQTFHYFQPSSWSKLDCLASLLAFEARGKGTVRPAEEWGRNDGRREKKRETGQANFSQLAVRSNFSALAREFPTSRPLGSARLNSVAAFRKTMMYESGRLEVAAGRAQLLRRRRLMEI